MQVTLKDNSLALIRRLTAADIPAADRLREAARWNQLPRDWERLISFEPDGCFAAETDGTVTGTATTTVYDGKVAWIGMVLVDPQARGKGLGRVLLNTCIEHLQNRGVPSIKLDATALGEPLYLKLGFQGYHAISRMRGTASATGPSGARPATEADLPAIIDLDAAAFGSRRGQVVSALYQDYPEMARVVENGGAVEGMVLGRRGSRAAQIGPLAARDGGCATALLAAAMNSAAGSNCVIDVPQGSSAVMKWLSEAGFSEERSFSRMFLGENARPENWDRYLAVHCPELG
ncbi:MAG: GNAT family N-acetyltransferase [Planctomycetes bacterium]|nr:GNAT family N-acetyltransferase [Planctomycetota bacterium]